MDSVAIDSKPKRFYEINYIDNICFSSIEKSELIKQFSIYLNIEGLEKTSNCIESVIRIKLLGYKRRKINLNKKM